MSDIIHLLPDSVANQIAAGEVIQRPASVLKELVENSIDAGADTIHILIKNAGRTLIQITDNGKGMSETDARLAFERHATSKITDIADIYALQSLGFRGEALASIAAVAQVELRTRRSEDELGTLIEIAGSKVIRQEYVQCDVGTTMLVKNLFFNVPARRRFLKSDNVERIHLLNEFYRVALVHPQILFSFYDEDEELFHLPPSNLKIRIENIFGKSTKKRWEQQLLPVETSTPLAKIEGFIGRPEFALKSPYQYFFVNGRFMRHPYFHKAILMAYSQMIKAEESPNYFIYFQVDPATIDVNVHPTKTEIKFENEQAIWAILHAAIRETLGKYNVIPSINFNQEGAIDIPVIQPGDKIVPPQPSFNPSFNPFETSVYKRSSLDWEELYKGFEKNRPTTDSTLQWEQKVHPEDTDSGIALEKNQSLDARENTSFLQLKNQYILTGIKSGLLLIHQRRAHIRILYEKFLQQLKHQKGASQQLLFPEFLEFSPEEALYFETLKKDLSNVGFIFRKRRKIIMKLPEFRVNWIQSISTNFLLT
jgi:DNA mismatch repair protein MutL